MEDLIIKDNGDVRISNGDLVIGFSDLQHQEHLLIAQKGSVKQYPDVGVGLESYLNESEIEEMLEMTNVEFTKDGMEVEKLKYDKQTGELNYDANY